MRRGAGEAPPLAKVLLPFSSQAVMPEGAGSGPLARRAGQAGYRLGAPWAR